jgi:CxxH/CxxC protein (TIGR04129 family)
MESIKRGVTAMEKKEIKTYVVCMEHVEYAIDDYVDFNELAPDVVQVTETITCDRCDQPAQFKLVPQS